MDQLAAEANKDPFDFRLALLKDKPRHVGVLKLAAETAGWTTLRWWGGCGHDASFGQR